MLLLFDIDGTLLLKATDAHREALHAALREVHGIDVPDGRMDVAGWTDPAICRAILTRAGAPATRFDDSVDALRDAACAAYARLCPEDLSGAVAPGVPGALTKLRDAGHVLALLTGNLEPIARLKLRRAGLGSWFAAGQGAFGSDHEDRAALPAVARRRAGRPHEPVRREDTVVIGDTPLDVKCARADGVRCVAVATGPYRAQDLAGADVVVGAAAELPDAVASLAG